MSETPAPNQYIIDSNLLPKGEAVFESEDQRRELLEYIRKKEELLGQMEVSIRERDDKETVDRAESETVARAGASYTNNRALGDLIQSNLAISQLEKQVGDLDRIHLPLLIELGNKWLNALITTSGAFGLGENNRVQNPDISAQLTGEATVHWDCDDNYDYYRKFDPKKYWSIQVGEEGKPYEFGVQYIFSTRQPKEIRHKSAILSDERIVQNTQLWNLYSEIFKAAYPPGQP